MLVKWINKWPPRLAVWTWYLTSPSLGFIIRKWKWWQCLPHRVVTLNEETGEVCFIDISCCHHSHYQGFLLARCVQEGWAGHQCIIWRDRRISFPDAQYYRRVITQKPFLSSSCMCPWGTGEGLDPHKCVCTCDWCGICARCTTQWDG